MVTATAPEVQIDAMHLALFVEEMPRSVAFYEVLFGVSPAKNFEDYAKFEVADPPVVFSLQPRFRRAGASLSHMGLRMKTPEQVLATQQRLIDAGYKISRQDGVTCGYAVQSKCWVFDPDGNPWEIYVLERDVEPTSGNACISRLAPSQNLASDGETIEIDLSGSGQFTLPAGAGASEVKLRGWPTGGWSQVEPAFKTLEAPRVTWDLEATTTTDSVSAYPLVSDVISAISRTGRFRVLIESIIPTGESRVSVRLAISRVAQATSGDGHRSVLYRGPMARIIDANGRVWERGVRAPISEAEWNELLLLHLAEHFSLAEDGAAPMCSTGD